MPPLLGPAAQRNRDGQLRIAAVVPAQGPAAIYGPSAEAAVQLAAHDLNCQGGVLGREVRIELVDGGLSPAVVATKIRELMDAGRIDAVTGIHFTPVRNAVASVTTGRIPFVYTAEYEGGADLPGVYYSGPTPDQQIRPAMRWLRDNAGVRSWYFVGSNFEWPRRILPEVQRYAHELGVDVVGGTFVEVGGDMTEAVAKTEASCAQAVMMMLVGQEAVDYNRLFGSIGLHTTMLRFGPIVEEHVLQASGAANTRGILTAPGYADSGAVPAMRDMRNRYTRFHGPAAPQLSWPGSTCYEGVQVVAALAERNGGLNELPATADGVAYDSPRGVVEFHTGKAVQHVYMATAAGVDLSVVERI